MSPRESEAGYRFELSRRVVWWKEAGSIQCVPEAGSSGGHLFPIALFLYIMNDVRRQYKRLAAFRGVSFPLRGVSCQLSVVSCEDCGWRPRTTAMANVLCNGQLTTDH